MVIIEYERKYTAIPQCEWILFKLYMNMNQSTEKSFQSVE